MTLIPQTRLKPRKNPVQARAKATVDAIFEATAQVLLSEGLARLTTNHVATRAGVSIGTLYQYFPGKEALLYALVEQLLDQVASQIEEACAAAERPRLDDCAAVFVETYFAAKTGDPEKARALYLASSHLEMSALVSRTIVRLQDAAAQMLRRCPEVGGAPPDEVVTCWVAVVTGGTRQILEDTNSAMLLPGFHIELTRLSSAYLRSAFSSDPKRSDG